jgi:uncharacterized protein (DUF1499 family)
MEPSEPLRSLAPCPAKPNCVSSQSADPRHHVESLRYRGAADAAGLAARRAVAALPRTRIVEEESGYLRAEATSRLFRVVDDLELLLAPGEGAIHVRSASRVGYSDLGVNRQRVEALRAALRQAGVGA